LSWQRSVVGAIVVNFRAADVDIVKAADSSSSANGSVAPNSLIAVATVD